MAAAIVFKLLAIVMSMVVGLFSLAVLAALLFVVFWLARSAMAGRGTAA